jgi:competence protein ComFC
MLDTGSRIPFCHACLHTIGRPLPAKTCERCGRPRSPAAPEAEISPWLCRLCQHGIYDFDIARSFGAYTPTMARAVLMLKYSNISPLGKVFAGYLAQLARSGAGDFAADVLVPVPLHPTRMRERGYNQAEAIARPLARLLGIPHRSFLLVRTRSRPDKLRLTRRERWETVRGAYSTREGAAVDKLRVMLVDDVFTTGATLDACSRALRCAGATRVVGLTVARANPLEIAPDAPYLPSGIDL